MFFRLLRSLLCFCLPLLLLSCAHPHEKNKHPACQRNPFLQRYQCSLANVQQAAMRGDADAEYALGYMYYNGIDTPVDTSAALVWIRKSAAQGQDLAQQALKVMQKVPSQPAATGSSQKSHRVLPKKTYSQQKALKANEASVETKKKLSLTKTRGVPRRSIFAIVKTPPQHFALQLMASRNPEKLKSAYKRYRLKNSYWFVKKQNGQVWTVWIQGNYRTRLAAQQAVATLPAALRASGPWVKSYAQIQREYRSAV